MTDDRGQKTEDKIHISIVHVLVTVNVLVLDFR